MKYPRDIAERKPHIRMIYNGRLDLWFYTCSQHFPNSIISTAYYARLKDCWRMFEKMKSQQIMAVNTILGRQHDHII